MKKQKPNRMSKKNRKYIKGSAAHYRRKLTQFNQREARKNGIISPRRLARSVGVFVGQVTDEISANKAAYNWKAYVEGVIKHPREFRAMMNPVKDIRDSSGRVIRKVEG
jgi:hypothetical protein